MNEITALIVIPFITWFGTFYYYQAGMTLLGCRPDQPACILYATIYGHRLGFLGALFCIGAQNFIRPYGHPFIMNPVQEQFYEAALVMAFIGFLLLFIYQGLLRKMGFRLLVDYNIESRYFVLRRKFINGIGSATFVVGVAIILGAIYGSH
jgi:hypothetical protein